MPYDSDAQRRFFHTVTARKHGITPAITSEFDKASKGMHLPEHAGYADGGQVTCPQCGHGFSAGGEVDDDDDDFTDSSFEQDEGGDGGDPRASFAAALRRRRMY